MNNVDKKIQLNTIKYEVTYVVSKLKARPRKLNR